MKPTLQFLQQSFEKYNRKIFGGRLPEVNIGLCEATSFIGQYKSKVRTLPDGTRQHYDHQLKFSLSFDLAKDELEDTVIHEMIHFFIAWNELTDSSTHGHLFKALMRSINDTHGRHITISHRLSHSQLATARATKKKWHVIAILHFSSGEKGVKVLPRVIPKIIDYYNQIIAASNIEEVDLYLHCDPFFNRYPTSVSRRCQLITQEEIDSHIKGAHILEVRNGKLIQR